MEGEPGGNPNQMTLFEIAVGDFAIRSLHNVTQLFDELQFAREQLPDNVVPLFRTYPNIVA